MFEILKPNVPASKANSKPTPPRVSLTPTGKGCTLLLNPTVLWWISNPTVLIACSLEESPVGTYLLPLF